MGENVSRWRKPHEQFMYEYGRWSEFIRAYANHLQHTHCAGHAHLYRIIQRMRKNGASFDAQYIICQAWHEIRNELCTQETF